MIFLVTIFSGCEYTNFHEKKYALFVRKLVAIRVFVAKLVSITQIKTGRSPALLLLFFYSRQSHRGLSRLQFGPGKLFVPT